VSGRLSNQFARILRDAGLRKKEESAGKGRETKRARNALSFHSFRHTATSWMKAAGIPASVVMDFIGHDDVAMSRLYTHTGEDALRVAADSMPNL
jgi:integrase